MSIADKRRAGTAAVIATMCLALFLLAAGSAFATDTTTRTEADIQARWHQLMPMYSGSPYATAPSLSAPYAAGSLASGFLGDGLNTVNYVRYLAGLPDDVVIDPTYQDWAQHGSVLLDASGFSHTPSRPADMDTAFYNLGYKATSASNIGLGNETLASFVFNCMDDSDAENIRMLGHRRWILYPPIAKTGLGFADTRSDMYVFDYSRTPAATYDSIKWPAAGVFPAEVVNAYTPWSVTLNPATYTVAAGTAGYQVTLRRVNDGKTWTFTSADTNAGGEYFNVETSRYGIANCIIFRPDPNTIGNYQPGDKFQVTLSGPIKRVSDGKPVTVTYETDFISQDGPKTAIRLAGAPSVKRKRTYALSGTIAPVSATGNVQITLKRYSRGKWRSAGSAKVTISGGRFRYTFKPKYRGKWRATVRYGALTTASIVTQTTSATKGFRVK